MSRTLRRVDGNGVAGVFTAPAPWMAATHAQQTRDDLDINHLFLQRNIVVGGSDQSGIDASSAGDKDILNWMPVETDNTSSQLSGFSDANGATLVARFRYMLRVSNVAINITPKILYGTTWPTFGTTATISGQAACAANDADYSGSNQYQSVLITLPSGVKLWKPVITVAGTPAGGYLAYVRVMFDLFIQS